MFYIHLKNMKAINAKEADIECEIKRAVLSERFI